MKAVARKATTVMAMNEEVGSKSTVAGADDVANLCTKVMTEQVVEPFIRLLGVLVEKGCDPNAKVNKLKWIRDIEAKRAELQNAAAVNQHEVKKREEVLKEIRAKQRE